MDDYIAKPVRLEDLAQAVQRWTNSGQQSALSQPPDLRLPVTQQAPTP
jgi:hypothetical protein